MFLEDFKPGMKVVPISKTVVMPDGSYRICIPTFSVAWCRAIKDNEKPFLVVIDVDEERERILCNTEPSLGGDYFKEWDLEPYRD